jgi:hypothetical protein
MSTLTANLKHLYLRRGYWLAHVVFGLLAYVSVMAALKYSGMNVIDMMMSGLTGIAAFMLLGKAHFMGLVLLALPIGFCAALVPIDVLSKPFSYCLPGHQRVPGKFTLSIGLGVNALGSLVFLAYPNLNVWQKIPVVCSAFGAGSMMYWLGAWLAWRARTWLILFPSLFLLDGVRLIAEHTIVEAPFEITVLGILSSLTGWWWLTNKTHARQFCAVPRLGLLDMWNTQKVKRYMQSAAGSMKGKRKGRPRPWVERFFLNRLKGHPHTWVEEFFLNRMNQCRYLGVGRHIWGGLYTTFAVVLSQWKGILAMLLFGWCLGSISFELPYMVFSFLAVIVAGMAPPIRTSVFTPQGRKERFITVALVGVTIVMLTTTIMMATTALSVVLAPLTQKITFWGNPVFPLRALDIRSLCLFVLAMPGALTLQVIMHKRPMFMRMSVCLLLFFAVSMPDLLSALWPVLGKPILPSMLLEPIIKPIPIATFVVLSWVVYMAVLWYFCMKRSLVGQSRTY